MGQAQRAKAGKQTWYSMLGSYRLFRQMAHVSVQMAQDHIATAFHFLISNRFPVAGLATALPVDGPAGSTSISSTSPWTCPSIQAGSRAWECASARARQQAHCRHWAG